MPKLRPETQRARRETILNAAEACFTRAGFHQSTMQDICAEAGLSAGALYAHFDSKEALICGIVQRETVGFAERLSAAASNAESFLDALSDVAEHYTVHEPPEKNRLFLEIGTEATRNEAVAAHFRDLHHAIRTNLTQQISAAQSSGQIASSQPPETIADLIGVLGDGLCWRRATDPAFDAGALLPPVLDIIADILKPTGTAGKPNTSEPRTANEQAARPEKETV
ncbi:MAG: TetR/AcrR family transcriptional regulator [Pseudomonadota bacterium]